MAISGRYTYNLDDSVADAPSLSLHIDVDGTDSLQVVSGTVEQTDSAHFIGRASSHRQLTPGIDEVLVDNFSLQWPDTSSTIEKIRVLVYQNANTAYVAYFTDYNANQGFGYYPCTFTSKFFREVEVEIDREEGALAVESYNTHTHPDRPADLPNENLTIETAFAKAGLKITHSGGTNVIRTSEAGGNNRWNEQELHDAMEAHWSAFANQAQWKLWIFMAELADSDTLGGIMFDGNIDEPGGVDRQGTALFTKSPYFHTAGGGYPQANPPAQEAATRELFFNLMHETGHAFNLFHSFQKTLQTDWDAPAWMPVVSDAQALSWMNYPDQATPQTGANATWFYERFRFRFDDSELLFLRHAPEKYVQMGAAAWGDNHARAARKSLDPRLQLVLRSRKKVVEMGEPVSVEVRLRNVSNEAVTVHPLLSLSDGFVEVAVTNPRGERRPLIPMYQSRTFMSEHVLEPGQSLYHSLPLAVGRFGIPFKEPGPYRLEASYTNLDGRRTASNMELWVAHAASSDDLGAIVELFDARVGRVLQVGGTRVMEDVNDKLKWVSERLGPKHPAQLHLRAVCHAPLASASKYIEPGTGQLRMREADPEQVERELAPLLEEAEAAADTIGHIEYRRVVDLYTQSAMAANKTTNARHAQEVLAGLFKQRGVLESVIEEIEGKVRELR